MISNPTCKGKTSEAVMLAALVKLGESVLVPCGEDPYELALDERGRLVRIQCNTGHSRDGCANCASQRALLTAAQRRAYRQLTIAALGLDLPSLARHLRNRRLQRVPELRRVPRIDIAA